MSKQQNIYVLEQMNGLVKIGIAENVEKRVATLERTGGFIRKNLQSFGPFSNARDIEFKVHAAFDKSRLIGEWFSIDFAIAATVTATMVENYGGTRLSSDDIDFEPTLQFLLADKQRQLDELKKECIEAFPIKGFVKDILVEKDEIFLVVDDGSIIPYSFFKNMTFALGGKSNV